MAATALVELEGHIVDSLMLAKVLDIILDVGADYVVEEFRLGKTQQDMSFVRVQVTAKNDHALDALLEELQVHGVNRLVLVETDAVTLPASQDGVFPSGFCVTTNLVTRCGLVGYGGACRIRKWTVGCAWLARGKASVLTRCQCIVS